MTKNISIKAQLFEVLSCYGDDKPFLFIQNVNSKSAELLLMLLHYGKNVVSRNLVKETLYDNQDIDFANSYKALIFRLRKFLIESIGEDILVLSHGYICFKDDVKVECDSSAFVEAYKNRQENSIKSLERVCELYHGEFLPTFQKKAWANKENKVLVSYFSECSRKLAQIYLDNNNYEAAYKVYKRISSFFPMEEEWVIACIDALLAMNMYREALKEYELISKLIFDEKGIYPSKLLLEKVRFINDKLAEYYEKNGGIDLELQDDEDETGAYYLTYPSFIDTYRMLGRVKQRENISTTFVLFTLSLNKDEKVSVGMNKLRKAISDNLRRSDMLTSAGKNQVLVMLWGTSRKMANNAIKRIISHCGDLKVKYKVIKEDEKIEELEEKNKLGYKS